MGTWLPGPGPTDGNDVYFGDIGVDVVDGGDGDDQLRGDFGDDTLTGGYGRDTLTGGSGNDTLYGDDGDDDLSAGEGVDVLFGGFGNDRLRSGFDPGTGNDSYFAGPGDDLISFETGAISGVVTIDGGDGFDAITVGANANVTFVPGSSVSNVEAIVLGGTLTLDFSVLSSITNIWGGGGALIMRTAETWDLSAFSIPASFSYYPNGPTPSVRDNAELGIMGSTGNDTIILPRSVGASFNIFSGIGNDIVHGSDGQDLLVGGQGDDVVYGYGGNDTIGLFGGGVDIAYGGAGDDTFLFRGDNYPNYVDVPATTPLVVTADGGEGNDTLIITQGYIGAGTSFVGIETTMISYGGQGPIRVAGGALPTTGTLILDHAQITQTSAGTLDFSAVYIPGASTTLDPDLFYVGSSGNDTLLWSPTSMAILFANAGAGDDVIRGGAGNDQLNGGTGTNTVDGGAGDDILIGSSLTTFIGGAGVDVVDFRSVGGVGIDLESTSGGAAFGSTFSGIEWFYGHNTLGDFMSGDSAANNFVGGGGNDTLDGRGGDDFLDGGDGDDTLYGGAGNDVLHNAYAAFGGDGDDIIYGGFTVDGGAGSDTIDWSPVFSVAIDLQAGTATPHGGGTQSLISIENAIGSGTLRGDGAANVLTGLAADDILEGRRGADLLNGAGGSDTVVLANATQGVEVNLITGTSWDGFETDTLISIENVEGSAFADHITGTDADNVFIGNAGGDTIIGNGGSDTLSYRDSTAGVNVDLFSQAASGGSAQGDIIQSIENVIGSRHGDVFVASADANYFDGWAGFDTVSYASSAYAIVADYTSYPVVWDGVSWDQLWGVEAVIGSAFDDVIVWRDPSANTLSGGAGDDLMDAGDGGDILNGGDGSDTAAYGQVAIFGGVVASLANPSSNTGFAAGDVYVSIENLSGSVNPDSLTGDDAANVLTGLEGNDILNGLGGRDTLLGGVGNDTLNGGVDNDILDGGAGADQLSGGAGVDAIDGGDGDDFIYADSFDTLVSGGAGVDWVYFLDGGDATINAGTAGVEVVLASSGNDTINAATQTVNFYTYAGAGNDIVTGGSGDDGLYGQDGNDTIVGGLGADLIWGEGGADSLSGGDGDDTFIADSLDTLISGGAGVDWVYFIDGLPVTFDAGANSVEVIVVVGSAADAFNATSQTAVFTVYASGGNDTITGGSNNDNLYGQDGADTIVGGGGNDLIWGEGGIDSLSGGDGDDTIIADSTDSLVSGGDGVDWVYYIDNGNVVLDAGARGVEVALTGSGADTLNAATQTANFAAYAGGGADIITGGTGNDGLFGQDGDDTIAGGNGNDVLLGEGGSDILNGGAGGDIIAGGAGADTFVYQAGWGGDSVLDFQNGVDHFDMTALAANGVTSIANLTISTSGLDAIISWNGNLIVVQNAAGQIDSSDFIFGP